MFFLLLILAVFALVPYSSYTSQAQDNSAVVTTDQLNVRQSPSSSAALVGQLPLNATVTMQGRDPNPNDGQTWILVEGAGLKGWVAVNFLRYTTNIDLLPVVNDAGLAAPAAGNTASTTTTSSTGETAAPAAAPVSVEGGVAATVIADANVRAAPSAGAARLTGAFAGANITLVGRSADNQWVRAVFPDATGWVSASLIQASAPISGLPVTNANGEVVGGGAPAAEAATTTTTTAPVNVAAPLPSSAGRGGYEYGAHVNGFGGVEQMSGLGMTWIKKQVRYNRGDSPDNFSWMITESQGRGFKVLLGVVGSPSDIANGGDAYFQEYATFVGGLAARGANAIEVWNEPNLDREWPTGQVSATQYTRLLALSYNAIKAANPGTMVISGAPAPTGFFGGCSPNGCDDGVYLAEMKAAGAAAYMDCAGAHYNEGIVPPNQTSGDPRSEFYTRYLPGMIRAYSTFGKPVCFTELGYASPDGYGGMPPGFEWANNTSVQEQAQWLAQAIRTAPSYGNVRLLIVWNYNFVTGPGTPDPMGAYAMLRPDGSCPACDALRR
jgi:uncharacterized protein YraI